MHAKKFLLILMLILPVQGGCLQSSSQVDDQANVSLETIQVSLVVDFGNGSTINDQANLELPATVLGLLEAVKSDSGLEFEHSGSGETAFIKSINGVANEGNGGKNWTFRINGKLGDCSCGVANINEGDEVLWTLGDYKPDEKD